MQLRGVDPYAARRVVATAAMLVVGACSGSDGGTENNPAETGTVSGSVRADGGGVGGAGIALSGGASANRTTPASGAYQFDALAPGSYTVTITPPAGFELAAGQTAARNATVAAGEVTTVDWALESTGGGGGVQVINLSGTSFLPSNVQIAAGTTVRWVAQEGAHTVTPDDPGQAGVWTSTGLSAGETFEHTFNVSGTYDYHCQPHQALGMTGRIVVQ